jgi:hypothetical protein
MSEALVQRWFGESTLDLVRQLRRLADDIEAASSLVDYEPNEAPIIDDWFIGQRAVACVLGRFTNHPKISDGKPGATSELFWVDEDRGVARTLSRWYRLGNRMDQRLLNQSREKPQ